MNEVSDAKWGKWVAGQKGFGITWQSEEERMREVLKRYRTCIKEQVLEMQSPPWDVV